ncbi:gamma-tubulin complex component 6 isoform X1 [Rhipicephalus sanguineus]|uniref:gamma-tubulin complex component 6 isoform X1 n=1 Tax=Rhipicephalus sanguineus TaxID=34632 RepID=UPI0018931893|nr:gamma-tubulin complex component 6 isoform X1 [Rhipicephalus sanguineus]
MEVDVPTVVTRLSTSVAGGAKSDVPVRELKKLAFSFLLKLDNRPPTSSPGTWPVEDHIAAEAFALHLQGRHCDALRLRECLTWLKRGRYSREVRACLEFLLHMAHGGATSVRQRLFELPPIVPAHEHRVPLCLVPGVPAFREYPRQVFERLDDELHNVNNWDTLFLPGLCAAEPACDLNGNPLFKLRCHSWQLDPPKVPPLTTFTRNRVLIKFSKRPAKLEPLAAVRPPSKQAQPTCMTEQDWQYVVHAGRRKHFTWESVGGVTSLVEHPFVTEAGGSEGEAVCQLGMLSLAALTGAQPSSPLGHEGLVHKALLLLVGIPSDIFPYDPVLRKFSIQGGARLKGTSSEALSASLCCFLQCGRDIRFLEDLVSSDVKPTLTWQAFVGALRHFLHYFHGCLLPMAGRADTLTILQLTHIVSSLCNSVRCITDICRSAVQVQEVASQRQQSMLLLRHLCQCARSCWGQEASSLVAFLLRQSCRPYLRFLEEWLYGGCCNDPYEEFPLVVHKQEVEMRDERFWEKGFQYAASEAPFLAPFMPQVFTSAKSAMLLKVCKPQSGLLWSKQLRPELRLSFSSRQLAQARELSERYGRLMESELQLLPLPKFRLGLDPHINIPEEWIEAQEELVDRQSRLLYAIPRSPSSASRCFMPCSRSAAQPLQAAVAESHEDLLYSVMTGTHMKVSGRGYITMETGHSNNNLGLFCETAGTYGSRAQRNLFGHASDSQLGDILYPDKSRGSTTERNRVTDNPTMLSTTCSETGETLMPARGHAKTCSLEDDGWESEGLLHQSCGDSPGLLLSEPVDDEPHGTQHGGGDASLLPADTSDSLASLNMTAEPRESSRLAFFSPTSGECSADGGLPLDIAVKRSLLPPLMSQMKLLNRVCVSYLVTELRLYDHLEALTNYYCFQDGEFGQALCDAICHKLKSPAEFLNPRTLNWILSQALSSSLRGECAEARNLRLDACPVAIPPGQNILNCLSLSYKVDWPLSVVINRACLLRYNKIFRFLLSLRRALWALSDIWSRLKPSALPRKPDSSLEFRQLQLMRHEMLHFVQMVQSYVGSQVLQASLAELRTELNREAQSVDNIRNAHFAFLKRLSQRLLLGRRAVPVRKLLNEALSVVLFFQTELAEYSWRVEEGSQLSHPSFAKFATAHAKFQKTVATLQTASRSFHQSPMSCLKLCEVLDCSALHWPDEASAIMGKNIS